MNFIIYRMFEDDAVVMFKEGKDAVEAVLHNNKEVILMIFCRF